jgi:hypothetical protein
MGRDSYLVRIYNRPELTGLEEEGESMTGIVEDIDTGTRYTFHNMEELWKFMAEHQPGMQNWPETKN